MIDDVRDCPRCGSEQEFVQLHPGPGGCPDSGDGSCPEWFCVGCGTALLAGVPPADRDLAGAPVPRAGGRSAARRAAGRLGRVA